MKKSHWLRCSHATKFWLIERQGENPSAHSVAIKNQRAIDFITFSCDYEFTPVNPANISSGGDLEIPLAYTLTFRKILAASSKSFEKSINSFKTHFKEVESPTSPYLSECQVYVLSYTINAH